MSFWERFFRELDVEQEIHSSKTLEENIDLISAALKQANLKVPVRLEAAGASIKLRRSFAPFRPGPASIFCGNLNQANNIVTLKGKIAIAPFYRVYFQIFLVLGVAGSLATSTGAIWRWASIMLREHRSDLSMLEVCGAGLAVLLILVAVVKILVGLNYVSTRGQREKIVDALRSVEA